MTSFCIERKKDRGRRDVIRERERDRERERERERDGKWKGVGERVDLFE